MRRALAALAVATTILLLGSCGVPSRDHADPADPEDVPFGLLDEETSSEAAQRAGSPVDVYFYDATSERLVRVALTTDDAALDTVLRLLQAPGGSGLPVGNPLGDVDVVVAAEVARGRATVDLAESFRDLAGTDQRVSLAELVYTATGRPGVGQVSFTLDGQPIEVPRGDGSLTSEPLTRSDYPELAPAD
jgi:spore germination protein GerM